MNRIKLTSYTSAIICGVILALSGSIITQIINEYKFYEEQSVSFVTAQSLGLMIGAFLGGYLTAIFGIKKIRLIAPAFFIGCFLALAFAGSEPVIYVLFLLFSAAVGICLYTISVDILKKDENCDIFVLYSFYAIGYFAGPFLMNSVTGSGFSWKITPIVIAVFSITVLWGYLKNYKIEKEENKKAEPLNYKDIRSRKFIFCMLAFFLYFGLEACLYTFSPIYLSSLFEKNDAYFLFSLFLLIIVFARLFTGFFLKNFNRDKLIMIMYAGLFVCLFAEFLSGIPALSAVFFIASAIFFGGLFPLITKEIWNLFRFDTSGGGIFLAIGFFGAYILPKALALCPVSLAVMAGISLLNFAVFTLKKCGKI